ncbi:hypothetical protein [Candidatus Nitrospira bockiana]
MPRIMAAIMISCFLTGCVAVQERPAGGPAIKTGGGPPPWAPAHGRRAKEAGTRYYYYYYPAAGVYMNVSTGTYFYLNGGQWQVGMSLPPTIVLASAEYVMLDLDTDKPYLYYDEHKAKYKGKGNRGKGRGNKHWND